MKIIVFMLVSGLLFAACDRGPKKIGPLNKNGDPIISDQFIDDDLKFPGDVPLFVALIKLNSPALLSSAQRSEDGTYRVDPQLKEAILQEQDEFEKKLQGISPSIHVIYRYRMVLNALAIEAPQALAEEINQLDVDFIEADERFSMPEIMEFARGDNTASPLTPNTMTFIGAEAIHENLFVTNKKGERLPVRGQGIKVGIIDSGVDYTHAMFGGPGDSSLFESLDPSQPNPYFPNAKVVGGYDFAGRDFNTRSHLFVNRIPKPDENPLDQSGHGTHVAGTVAGLGDGVNTYDGAAPDADIYALKVFGDKGGSTSDTVVIAALEFAADPNGDLSPSDKLDVLNLSLGGTFGKPHTLYNQAIGNLVNGGVVAVAAAGNAGAINSIVGAPSTSDDAISVAGSIDNMFHNWQFAAVEFTTQNHSQLLAEAVQGNLTQPISEAGAVTGKLVFIGAAAQDLSEKEKVALKGHVALIDRGLVSFRDKIKRAYEAGAIGVVMANNQPGDVVGMGGEDNYPIPGVMIPQDLGDVLKMEMELADVFINFASAKKVKRPELIDSMAGFSSQGPRDLDSAIKPEITAPGYAIISARAGSGTESAMMGGTSMAAPRVAGVAALLVQYRSQLKARQIKSLIMNTAKLIGGGSEGLYPISRQGAGRLQSFLAASTAVVFSQPGLSLGKLNITGPTSIHKQVEVTNFTDSFARYGLTVLNHPFMKVSLSESQISLAPGESRMLGVEVLVLPPDLETVELDSFIEIHNGQTRVGSLPVLAVANRTTMIGVENLFVQAPGPQGAAGANVTTSIQNWGGHDGFALLFNLLGKDGRKDSKLDPFLSVACDLESAGYRLVEREEEMVLQVAAKIYNPVTSWGTCDLNVEIDVDGDGVPDKLISGSSASSFPGLGELPYQGLVSAIFDAHKLQTILTDYSKELATQPEERPELSFEAAFEGIGPMVGFQHSTIAVVEAKLATLALPKTDVRFKVSVSYNGGDVIQRDDSLGEGDGAWLPVQLQKMGGGFAALPEAVLIPAGSSMQVPFLKGNDPDQNLVAYFPRNPFSLEKEGFDSQSQEIKAQYSKEAVQP